MSLPAAVPAPAVFPAVFPDVARPRARSAAEVREELERALAERIPGALTPRRRAADPPLASGVAEFDALCGGIPRGAVTEICGAASSGRTSLLLAMLAASTRRGEFCCLVDAGDCFHPESAAAAGVKLKQLLWVRCGRGGQSRRKASLFPERSPLAPWLRRVEQALKIADLVLQGGGFTLVAIDLAGVPAAAARRVPLASWFRFRRAVEDTASALVLVGAGPVTQSCAGLVVRTQLSAVGYRLLAEHAAISNQHSAREGSCPAKSAPAHAQLLESMGVRAHVLRNSAERGVIARKGPRAASAEWESKVAAGY
ncbi:MAG TPA: hypothetical protein VFA60_01630 [Terriglobales bacterium]|nr:hypothetical protein [Terriglobales bacterium]